MGPRRNHLGARRAGRRTNVGVMFAVIALAVAACGSGDGGSSSSASPEDALANLEVITTDVTVQADDASGPSAGESGQAMSVGDTVRTDANGFAEIGFFDGSLTRVDNEAEFTLVDLQDAENAAVVRSDLASGRSWNRIEKLSESDTWEVDTPVASATVRGTAFAADCAIAVPDACEFAVVEGVVELELPDGTTITLEAGDRITIVKDEPPPPPESVPVPRLLEDEWIARNVELDSAAGKPEIELASAGLDGHYVVLADLTCGGDQRLLTDQMLILAVDGEQATVTSGRFGDYSGTATLNGDAVEIRTFQGDGALEDWQRDRAELTGTFDGETMTGTAYTGQGTAMSSCTGPFTAARAGAPGASPCIFLDSLRDPSLEGLGPVGAAWACDDMYAVVNPPGSGGPLLWRWNGEVWESADPEAYCAEPPASIPTGLVGEEDQTGRIYQSICQAPPSSSTTSTFELRPLGEPLTCDQDAVKAAVAAAEPDASPVITVLACNEEWAVAVYSPLEDPVDLNAVLRFDGTKWGPAGQPVCETPGVPHDVEFFACYTH